MVFFELKIAAVLGIAVVFKDRKGQQISGGCKSSNLVLKIRQTVGDAEKCASATDSVISRKCSLALQFLAALWKLPVYKQIKSSVYVYVKTNKRF